VVVDEEGEKHIMKVPGKHHLSQAAQHEAGSAPWEAIDCDMGISDTYVLRCHNVEKHAQLHSSDFVAVKNMFCTYFVGPLRMFCCPLLVANRRHYRSP
jgi:hypothetical protein